MASENNECPYRYVNDFPYPEAPEIEPEPMYRPPIISDPSGEDLQILLELERFMRDVGRHIDRVGIIRPSPEEQRTLVFDKDTKEREEARSASDRRRNTQAYEEISVIVRRMIRQMEEMATACENIRELLKGKNRRFVKLKADSLKTTLQNPVGTTGIGYMTDEELVDTVRNIFAQFDTRDGTQLRHFLISRLRERLVEILERYIQLRNSVLKGIIVPIEKKRLPLFGGFYGHISDKLEKLGDIPAKALTVSEDLRLILEAVEYALHVE
jgi:hypothetical protein